MNQIEHTNKVNFEQSLGKVRFDLLGTNYNPTFNSNTLGSFTNNTYQPASYGGNVPSPLTYAANSAASLLPKTYNGTPLRDLLGVQKAYASDGSVLGTNTSTAPSGSNASYTNTTYSPSQSQLNDLNNIGYSNLNPAQQTQYNQLTQAQDPYSGVRNDISSAWDTYLNGLQGTQGYLNDQQTAQTGIADSQLAQGQNALNTQKANSLKDIANTTRNAFQAGNNYLGSLGAGDSSAANQYAFAINQQAGKQTGDLNNFVTSKLQELQSTHDQQIQSIASWFAQQQGQLKQQLAQGGLQKGQDLASLSKNILDQALQATNQIKQNTQNQYNGLLSWAANNSSNIGQLQQNISQIPQAMGQLQTFGPSSNPVGFGGAPTGQKTDIFGNIIR